MKALVLLAFTLILPVTVLPTSFQELIHEALESNQQIQSLRHAYEAEKYKSGYADRFPDPQVSYGYYVREVETRVGPQKHRLGVSQMIPGFGKRGLRKESAEALAEKKGQMLKLAELKLVRDLGTVLLDLHYSRQALEKYSETLKLLEAIEGIRNVGVHAGDKMVDLLQIQMETSRIQDQISGTREIAKRLEAKANVLLHRQASKSVELPPEIVKDITVQIRLASREEIEQNSPEIRSLNWGKMQEESRRKLVHRDRIPDVMVGLDWIQTDRALMPTLDSGKDPVIAKVSFHLPIWWGDYSRQDREAESRVSAAQEIMDFALDRLVSQSEIIVSTATDAKRRIELFAKTLIPQAEQVLGLLEEGYQTGEIDLERLLQVEMQLLEFRLQHERARVDLAKQALEYQVLIGEMIGNENV